MAHQIEQFTDGTVTTDCLTADQLQQVADQLWPVTGIDGEAAFLKKLARDRDLRMLFEQAPTQENIRGTAWAGYQAITEWLDHEQPARSDHHRAHKILTDGAVPNLKRHAFTLLRQVA